MQNDLTSSPARPAKPGLLQSLPAHWRPYAETAATLVVGLLLAVALRILVFEPFTIPSSSMEPGLVTGDYIIVSKPAYGWSRASIPFTPPLPEGRVLGRLAQRGDVVVFRSPTEAGKTLVKRVVGLPGDRVQMIGGALWVNGKAVARAIIGPATDHDDPSRTVLRVRETLTSGRSYETYGGMPGHEGDDTDVYLVPDGTYLVMGDNRDNSLDGRFPQSIGGVGYLPATNLVGKAELVLMSWRPSAALLKPWTWLDFQWERFFRAIR